MRLMLKPNLSLIQNVKYHYLHKNYK
jgi:hypothetical protein